MTIFKVSAFALVMVVYLAYPYFMIRSQERILREGELFRFELRPVDPVDAFRGRYLALNYDTPALGAPSDLMIDQTIHISLKLDDQGYARFSAPYPDPPADSAYLSARVISLNAGELYFDIPDSMVRYYLNEKTAPLAEKAVNEIFARSMESQEVAAYAQVRIRNGKALIEELYLEGVPLREYLEKQTRELE